MSVAEAQELLHRLTLGGDTSNILDHLKKIIITFPILPHANLQDPNTPKYLMVTRKRLKMNGIEKFIYFI